MPPGHYLLLFACFLASSLAGKSHNQQWVNNEWQASNTMSKEDGEIHQPIRYSDDTIDIDNENQVWSLDAPMADWPASGMRSDSDWDSSGYGDTEDGDDSESSGFGGYYPPAKSKCERLRQEILMQPVEGAYVPQCTSKGEYQSLQCDRFSNMCWCVNKHGQEIPHMRGTNLRERTCKNLQDTPYIPERRPGSGNEGGIPDLGKPDSSREGGDIDYGKEDPADVEITKVPMEEGEDEDDEEDRSHDKEDKEDKRGEENEAGDRDHHSSIIGTPGLLPGIIGGAVVGLLCAVLLVMFIVYRMRKKDEGSYALEEPKMTSPSRGYTRAPTKEYWA